MSTSVLRVSNELAETARQHGQLFNRSMAGQVEHWAQIGRAIEASPDFSIRKIAELLAVAERGLFPEHPHRRVAAMEAAVEVVGMRIAELSAELYRERRSSTRDEARIEALLARITVFSELQESLKPEDTELVTAILSGKIPGNDQIDN
jgi:hypothetical protein